jgi:hypothetical protein
MTSLLGLLSVFLVFYLSNAFFIGIARNQIVTSSQTLVKSSSMLQQPLLQQTQQRKNTNNELKMGFFDDAFRFFSNLNKEASAKHILIKGADASKKLTLLKAELANSTNISEDFSKLAAKVSYISATFMSICLLTSLSLSHDACMGTTSNRWPQ